MRRFLLYRPSLHLLPILLATLLMVSPVQGQNKKQLERDKAKIEKEIARLNTELTKARKNSKNSTKQITLIKSRIQERTRLIDNINGQMNILDRQIGRTEDSLRMVRGQIDSMKAEYARVVRTLYGLRQNVNSTGLLFDNEQYNYSYLKMKYFSEYSRYRKHQATAIKRREQLFSDMSLDLQRQRKEKTSLLAQERRQRDALSREQQQQQRNSTKASRTRRACNSRLVRRKSKNSSYSSRFSSLSIARLPRARPVGRRLLLARRATARDRVPHQAAARCTVMQHHPILHRTKGGCRGQCIISRCRESMAFIPIRLVDRTVTMASTLIVPLGQR